MERLYDSRPPFALLNGADPKELFSDLPTPCYIIDESALENNCRLLKRVSDGTGCRILLAQKAFSNYDFYPLFSKYLCGTEASGLFEARLGKEEMPGGETHVFCAAYRDCDFDELLLYADHIVFNSVAQLAKFGQKAKNAGTSLGLRVNPELSTQDSHAIYDPCAPGSRLGVTKAQWDSKMTPGLIDLLDGLHFHTLCEQDSDALAKTLAAFEEKFGAALNGMKWLNMGGGHHITRPGYGVELLESEIIRVSRKYGVQVYLEPGEACALNAGYLLTGVLDVTENGATTNVIIDSSAACHMPDVIEMPYTPPLYGSNEGGRFAYRIGGPTCLSGDIVGDYRFDLPVSVGDRLLFGDMAIYTTCKNNTFNGMPLPDIYKMKPDGSFEKLTRFGYSDFKSRLGGVKNQNIPFCQKY